MLQVVADLVGDHLRAVVLGFTGAGTQVGQCDGARVAMDRRAREIAHITAQALGGQRRQQRVVVDHSFAREVQEHRTRAHRLQRLGVDQVLGGGHQRHVDADEMRSLQQFGHRVRLADLSRQAPGGIDGDVGVVADHVHAQPDRRVGDQAADAAQSDHPKRVPGELEPRKCLLAVFDPRVHVGVAGVQAGDELQCGRQIARGHQHAGQHKFLDRVGVGARCVEHRHAARAHRRHRDVVRARARAPDGPHRARDGQRVHVGGAHENGVGIGDVLADFIEFCGQPLQAMG